MAALMDRRCGKGGVAATLVSMTALAVVLAVLCSSITSAAGKPDVFAIHVEETRTPLNLTSGPPDPNKGARKDGGAQGRPRKPGKPEQLSQFDTTVGIKDVKGNPGGRKLQAWGDPCSVYVKNACKSRKSFQVAYAYYTYDGLDSGGEIQGFESIGWVTVRYGARAGIQASKPLYLRTTNGLKPSRTVGSAESFCVSDSPFWILDGDDGNFYRYNGDGTYSQYDTCGDAGGYFSGNFWAPTFCGTTLNYINC